MVWVLQAQQSKCLWERRRLRARPTAQHPEKAKQEERARTRKRSSALAKRLLHHNGLVHLKTSTRCGMSIFLKVTTNWRAGCKKVACPVRREGRSFLRPYPYPTSNILGDYERSSITPICNFCDNSREDQAAAFSRTPNSELQTPNSKQ